MAQEIRFLFFAIVAVYIWAQLVFSPFWWGHMTERYVSVRYLDRCASDRQRIVNICSCRSDHLRRKSRNAVVVTGVLVIVFLELVEVASRA